MKETKIVHTLAPCSKCHIWHCPACGCPSTKPGASRQ